MRFCVAATAWSAFAFSSRAAASWDRAVFHLAELGAKVAMQGVENVDHVAVVRLEAHRRLQRTSPERGTGGSSWTGTAWVCSAVGPRIRPHAATTDASKARTGRKCRRVALRCYSPAVTDSTRECNEAAHGPSHRLHGRLPAMAELRSEVKDRVALVTLDAPARRNALTLELVDEIEAGFDAIESNPDVGAVVVTGAPPAFCAGADLSHLGSSQRRAWHASTRGSCASGARRCPPSPPSTGPPWAPASTWRWCAT